jgi:hypothetical protein
MVTISTHPTDGPVHTYFGLTYANYLVIPRTLMQSMPIGWQERMTACLDELHEAFQHIEQAEVYEVVPGVERTVSELSDTELKRTGYSVDWYGGEEPPEGLDTDDLNAWQHKHETEPVYYDRDLDEVDADTRVVLPADDPVPHYNRGRTYVEPRTA